MSAANKPAVHCPLCQAALVDRDACRAGCPWRHDCGLLRCASCGYEFPDPDRSVAARWLERWWRPPSKREVGP